jgi:starch phosphorylase
MQPISTFVVTPALPERQARVHLGTLRPDDVTVELVLGRVDGSGAIVAAEKVTISPAAGKSKGVVRYEASVAPRESGLYGYTVRILPHHPDLPRHSCRG